VVLHPLRSDQTRFPLIPSNAQPFHSLSLHCIFRSYDLLQSFAVKFIYDLCLTNNVNLTLNVCSFVHQCNTFTSYFLLIVYMFRPHTAIFRCYSILSRSWCSVMPIFAYVMLSAMCQPCAPDVVLIVSVRLLEYLCCLCGRHVACL
jgi:hypothetical protein